MLDVRDVHYRYHANGPWVLNGVGLRIEPGKIFGLLGPNGAGKTTLISIIVGLIAPTRGEIVSATSARPALVPQDLAFYPMLTGRENLAFFGGMLGLSGAALRRRENYCIEFTGLAAAIDRRAGHYSGGMKRRLNLAIGLMADAPLVLLDEPTVGVDPQSRAFILDAIRGLRAEGKTVVYTSHYMEEVEYLCDRVAIMDEGRVLLQGPLDQLLRGSAGLRLTFREDSPNDLAAALAPDFEVVSAGAREAVIRTPLKHSLSQLLQRCERHGAEIARLQHGAKNLEEVFMDLTRRRLRD